MFKILVVEDDKDLNRTVCSFLNQSGYEAVGCLGAEEAYDEMYKTVFDLIVSDIMMPGIDGFEFAKTVRSLNNDIPILFMTARDDFASKQRGFRIGIGTGNRGVCVFAVFGNCGRYECGGFCTLLRCDCGIFRMAVRTVRSGNGAVPYQQYCKLRTYLFSVSGYLDEGGGKTTSGKLRGTEGIVSL